MIRASLVLRCLLALAACLMTSCGFVPAWRYEQAEGVPFGDAWQVLEESVAASGYIGDASQTDKGKHVLMTKWRTRNDRMLGGVRTRVHAEVRKHRDGVEKGHEFRFAIEMQRNKNMAHIFDPDEGDWSAAGQDGGREEVLQRQIKLRVEQYQEAHGTRQGGSD